MDSEIDAKTFWKAIGCRAIGVAIVTAQVPREAWTACDRPPTQCLSGLRPAATVVNRSTHRTICGDVGLTIQEVLPWAWHGLSTVMPSQVVRVVVTC